MAKQHLSRRSLVAVGVASAVAASRPARAQTKAPVTLAIANSQWVDALRGKNLWNALLKYKQVAPHVTLEQVAIPSAEFDNKMRYGRLRRPLRPWR